MKMNTQKLLIPATRQYRHNRGDDTYVIAYDKEVTEQLFNKMQSSSNDMHELLTNIKQALEWGDTTSDTAENVLEYLPEINALLAKARGE